jgi:hypothetical protein
MPVTTPRAYHRPPNKEHAPVGVAIYDGQAITVGDDNLLARLVAVHGSPRFDLYTVPGGIPANQTET